MAKKSTKTTKADMPMKKMPKAMMEMKAMVMDKAMKAPKKSKKK